MRKVKQTARCNILRVIAITSLTRHADWWSFITIDTVPSGRLKNRKKIDQQFQAKVHQRDVPHLALAPRHRAFLDARRVANLVQTAGTKYASVLGFGTHEVSACHPDESTAWSCTQVVARDFAENRVRRFRRNRRLRRVGAHDGIPVCLVTQIHSDIAIGAWPLHRRGLQLQTGADVIAHMLQKESVHTLSAEIPIPESIIVRIARVNLRIGQDSRA
mmetsp:Transcript_21032/g.53714  ORF Transcript_21032/g.53714 Transcript_21032/m.53714 type:complete len:217 (+) Transcript_21032:196-846(+)